MKDQWEPYFVVNETVYFTDRIEEVIVFEDERREVAEKICSLLNDTYNAAYQDGLNASLNEQHKGLMSKVRSLSIENWQLKNKLKLLEDQ